MMDNKTILKHDNDGIYLVREVGEYHFDIYQKSSNVVVASAARKDTARRAAASLNACAVVPRMINASDLFDRRDSESKFAFQDLTPECGAPTGMHNFFMVRPKGIHPASGKKYILTPVQMIDGVLYSPGNAVAGLTWSLNGELMQGPTKDPYQANLEWCPVPD